MAAPAIGPQICILKANIFDGTRELLSADTNVLLTVVDGFQKQVYRDFRKGPTAFQVPFYDNLGDNYTVIAFADRYDQAGFFPVKVSGGFEANADLMLLPKKAEFNFSQAKWDTLRDTEPQLFALLAHGASSDDAARDRYTGLMEDRPAALAAFFNLTTAMSQIHLPAQTPLDYLKEPIWDRMQQDRFFAWADVAIKDQIRGAAASDVFQHTPESVALHPGSTDSYKQVQFGEANVQLTFHENDTQVIDGVNCFMIEPDMDYYRDLLAHAFLEVVVNGITGSLSDPKQVYVLRWIAGRHAGVAPFEPPYTIA